LFIHRTKGEENVGIRARSKTKTRRKTHTPTFTIELLAPPTPLTRTAKVRALYPTLLEKLPRGFPVFLLRLTRGSAHLLLKRGIYLVRERLERVDVSPRARAHGTREENAKGREAEAALALLGGLTPVEDADAAVGVFGEVPGSREDV